MNKRVRVNLGEKSYSIFIGDNNLRMIGDLIRELLPHVAKTFVISNTTVFPLYGEQVMDSLKRAGLNPGYGLLPDGEECKTLGYAEKFYDQLIEHGIDRSSLIISLGGGVVGDLAGFVAATFMRGVKFAQIPTTLLAQVDSSIGGKVAVNHKAGKNLIGAFHQPDFVLTDVSTLETLELDELIAGLGEVIKHGLALDREYFTYIEDNLDSILELRPSFMINLIEGSCILKGKVVEIDEEEMGYRKVLNFGHTVGHALEVITDYKKYKHGEAVAIGMVYACRLGQEMGMIDNRVTRRLVRLLDKIGLPTRIPGEIKPEQILEAMKKDKKSYRNKVKMILPKDVGQVEITDNWTKKDIIKIMQE